MERRRAFRVVDDFEEALCEFTGAPYAVTVDSCTNAIFLALKWAKPIAVTLPRNTYVGVVQAARNAGYDPYFLKSKWKGSYSIQGGIIDSAKEFERNMYRPGTFTCVSFQAGKLLPIGRGGAILHDNPEADEWFRTARLDGRTAGSDYKLNMYAGEGWHMYLDPPSAARGLWLMTYIDDQDSGSWTEYPNLAEATWT